MFDFLSVDTHMNYNFGWWLFFSRFFAIAHICNFCPRKLFDNNVFLMFYRLGDNITVYLLYDESPRITVVGALAFENVDFLTITWEWARLPSWGWLAEWLIKISCLLCWFSLSFIYLSSSTLERLRDTKLLRSLLSDVLSSAVFSVWQFFHLITIVIILILLFWKYFLLYFEFSIINLMIVPLLWSSLFRY